MHGGRGSGKSFACALMAAIWGYAEPLRILCTRELQVSIKESMHAEIKNAIESQPWLAAHYDIGEAYIRGKNGTEFIFRGLRHNISSIKSMAQIDLCIVEEAADVPDDSWKNLLPTIRAPKSEFFIVYNPKSKTDPVDVMFRRGQPPRSMVVEISHADNPWFPKELEEQRIHAKSVMSEEDYAWIWEGKYLEDTEGSVIKYAWVEAAIDAHIKLGIDLGGKRNVGYDVADSGADKNAAVTFDGAICLDIDEWAATEDALNQSTKRAWAHVQGGTMVYDSIGVGAHVGSTLDDMGIKTGFMKFNAGGAVVDPEKLYTVGIKNKDKFENVKAQAWQDVADRLRNTFNAVTKGETFEPSELISISSTCRGLDQLKIELSTPRKRYSKRGLDMVETKDELKARKIASPNKADGFIMGACPHLATGRRMGAFDF